MNRKTRVLLSIHAAASWFMTGVIWFVQLVHYPLLAFIGPDSFGVYAGANIGRTAAIVGPVMLIEAGAALLLVLRRPPGIGAGTVRIGAALLAAIWASTLFLQFPLHRALTGGFDAGLAGRLIDTNWIRTAGWTLRAWLALRMLLGADKT